LVSGAFTRFSQGLKAALHYLPISIPFALLTVVGGINVTESARVAGDGFKTRDILLTEAIATLIAGCAAAWPRRRLHRATRLQGHGLACRLHAADRAFHRLGGIFGYISFIVELIPRAVLAPILIFVALEIMVQAFLSCPRRHAVAAAFAFFPTLARLLAIKYTNPSLVPRRTPDSIDGHARQGVAGSPRHHRGWKRLHSHRHALGGISRRAHRQTVQPGVAVLGNNGHGDFLRRNPLGIA